jgi:hypothetical protein
MTRRRKRTVIFPYPIDAELLEQARDLVYWLEGTWTMTEFINQAFSEELKHWIRRHFPGGIPKRPRGKRKLPTGYSRRRHNVPTARR